MTPSRRTFLKQLGLGAGACVLGPRFSLGATGTFRLPRSTPEAEGVDSAGVQAFLDAIAQSKHELHGFMFAVHGRVVAEGWWAPYGPNLRHTLYSMSKSFTSTAVGLAVSEGHLHVEDLVTSFFPKDLPEQVGENLAALKVRDLLTMSVGNEKEPTGAVVQTENWVRTFLAQPITHPPGSAFLYNSAASYMLSAIVQHVTGKKVIDYLQPRLFDPLGIEGATWETCPRGINTGGWGLSVPTEALAKFGQLYLQRGQWEGRQLLPAAWVEEATTFKIQQPPIAKPTRSKETNDWQQGYCYQFWRCQHGGFRGDGAFGQYTIVLREQDAVIAMNGESSDMQGELDLVWEHLLPAIKGAPLPANQKAQERLQQTLAGLALVAPKGQASSPNGERVSKREFKLDANELGLMSVTFGFDGVGSAVHFRDAQKEYAFACGNAEWKLGETALPGTPPRIIAGGAPPAGTQHKVAASGTWKDDATFEMLWRYYETPHHDTVTCRFADDGVEIASVSSIAAMAGKPKDKRPILHGKLA